MWLDKFAISALVISCVQAIEDVQVEIPQGLLLGLQTSTVSQNKPYYSFKGIPYAKPNVGLDKFRTPEPAEPWEGVYNATQHRSTCPFICMINEFMGDEDCLYLNVYTPDLNKDARKAVMVWFHSGSWNAGSGNDDLYGPDFLIDQDVVVVTMNFRLGAIGFLNTGDKNAPGNAGMKDQVMALMWVKDNIHYFGGCPNRVTIFGQSSGGASVQYHMLSSMSEGLFNSGIAQSGSILNPWAISYSPREMAFKLGEILGIHTSNSEELVKSLAELPAKDLVMASMELTKSMHAVNGRMFAFVPSVEADLGQDIFISTDPWTLLKSGNLANVPIMGGLTIDEGSFFAEMLLQQADQLNDAFENFLPDDVNVTNPDQRHQLGEELKKSYLEDKQLSKDAEKEFTKMISDIYFTAGIAISLNMITLRNSAPVYQYKFGYEAPFGFMKNFMKSEKGVAHGDELGYEFYSNLLKNLPAAGSPAEKIMRIITKLWTNFAKDGNPTSKMDEDLTTEWIRKDQEECRYLYIDQQMKMDKHMLGDKGPIWMKLYSNVLG